MLGDLIRGRQEPYGHNPRLRTNVAYAVLGFTKWEVFGRVQDKPFNSAQDKPFGFPQDKPFDSAQDKPFGFPQDKPFGFTQDKLHEPPKSRYAPFLISILLKEISNPNSRV